MKEKEEKVKRENKFKVTGLASFDEKEKRNIFYFKLKSVNTHNHEGRKKN